MKDGGTHSIVGCRRDARKGHGPSGLHLGQRRNHVRAHVGGDDHPVLKTLVSGRVLRRTRVIARIRPLDGPKSQEVHGSLAPSAAAAAGRGVGRDHYRRRLRRPPARQRLDRD